MIKFKTGWRHKSFGESLLAPILAGERITLKAPTLNDYAEWSALRLDNKTYLTPYEPEWSKDFLSLEFFKRRLKRHDEDRKAGSAAYFYLHHKNQIIGGLNLNNIQTGAARHASLGYWIDQDHQGQGLMQEAVSLLIDHSFNRLKLRRLNAACLPDNIRSIKMLLKLGFEEEGYAKKYLQINGQWQDHKLFGLCNH